MTTLADHTVLPTTESDAVSDLKALAVVLDSDHPVELRNPIDGSAQVVPDTVRKVLQQVLAAMADHRAVTITEMNTTLTTQQAADLLGVSRPTLVRLLESNQIAFSKPNRHRRVQLADVLDYQRHASRIRRAELDAMTRESAEDNGFATVNGFVTTR